MNVNQTSSASQPKNSEAGGKTLSSVPGNQRLSFENIRSFRQHFEQGITPLRSILGDDQHQTMIVAMYEGTEKLLNQDVSEFAVFEYLEGLKLTAKENCMIIDEGYLRRYQPMYIPLSRVSLAFASKTKNNKEDTVLIAFLIKLIN